MDLKNFIPYNDSNNHHLINLDMAYKETRGIPGLSV